MGKKIFLLRHGNTGLGQRYVGARDVPLSPEGIKRIAALKPMVRDWSLDAVLVSPMLRCRQSAKLLSFPCSPAYEDDLREVDFGRWEGLNFSEICERDPELVESWASRGPSFSFPEGEEMATFQARVRIVGDRLAASSHQNILVISHGGVIRSLICHFLKLAAENDLLFQLDKGNYASLKLYSEGGVLTGLNLGAQ
ncbi:MAG: histidine phosphatase family protein [Thermodesulfobacteriota bacterium]